MIFYRFVRVASCSACSASCSGCASWARSDVPATGGVHPRAVAPVDARHPVRRARHAAHGALHGQGRAVRQSRARHGSSTRSARFPVERGRHRPRGACARSMPMLRAGEPVARVPRGHPPARARDRSRCSAGRRVPRAASRRADRAGRHRRQRGDPAPRAKLLPRFAPGRGRGRRADRARRRSRARCARGDGRRADRRSCRRRCSACFDDAVRVAVDGAGEPAALAVEAGEHVGRVDAAVVGERAAERRAPRRDRRRTASAATRVERGHQLAQLARRREVLVLVGDVHRLDAVGRVRAARSPPRRGPRARSRRR